MTSPIYRSPWLYRMVMRILYGRDYGKRFEVLAEMVEEGASVIDLCAGDCAVYEEALVRKEVSYHAVDINETFVRYARRRGLSAEKADVREYAFPLCDVVLLLDSLYQFPAFLESLVDQARRKAKILSILEPVRNVASHRWKIVRWLAAELTDYGEGPVETRFTERELRELWERHGVTEVRNLGRDLLGIWRFE
ncbi:MAG: class I SAM-dependent methyltransferase [Candidatus Hydrogenedentota bacterium]|nr:MAG: class I SAM-dependent methyltransferase [Candidatus Hydrogenedentota bacterium]